MEWLPKSSKSSPCETNTNYRAKSENNGQTVYNMGTFAEKWVNIWSVQARNHGGKRAIGAPEISENMIRF